MKVTITKIYTTNKDKSGNLLTNRNGNPYTRMSIKTDQHGEAWLSGFENQSNANWKEGDVVDIEVEKSVSGDKTYLNFKNLSEMQLLINKVDDLIKRVEVLEKQGLATSVEDLRQDIPELTDDDIPDFG